MNELSRAATEIGQAITVERLTDDPYPIFQQMLAHEPVCWVPNLNMWMVTRYQDVVALLKDADTFTMEPQPNYPNPMEEMFGPMMLSIDGPQHKRVRDVFIEPFRPRHVRTWYTQTIEAIAERLIDEMITQGTADLDKAFSDKLAIFTIVTTLGFDVDDVRRFRDWYDDFGHGIANIGGDPTIEARGKRAFALFRAAVIDHIERLKASPNQSVLSEIVNRYSDRLSTNEIVSNVALTFFGGVETTSAMLSNTIYAFLKHPDQLAAAKKEPAAFKNGIEEALRWETPVKGAMRFPTRPVTLHGVELAAGEKIYGMLGAANRDPRLFPDGDRFDIERQNASKHLSFAYGPHFCFGAPLARMEAEIGLGRLFDRLPKLRLDPDYLTKPTGHEFRSPEKLICRWD